MKNIENNAPTVSLPVSPEFQPFPGLAGSHLMTIVTAFVPRGRSLLRLPFEEHFVAVDSESSLLAKTHLNPANKGCLIIVHGLEGSSESPYVLGLSAKAISLGFNVVRLNLRNCGDTLHLTPTLYNAGQSSDLLKVSKWLAEEKNQQEQYLVGYSLGGNLVLKTLAEAGQEYSFVKGGCAVSPSVDLAASVNRLKVGLNRIYEYSFLRSLRKKIKQKSKLFPQRFDARKLSKVNTLLSFDNVYTAPDAGFENAAQYYQWASSYKLLNEIKKPTLIIAAQDDPLVPPASFAEIDNANVYLLAPKHGGHVAFLANHKNYPKKDIAGSKDYFWADGQILSFCRRVSQLEPSIIYT